jgi:rhamnulose-1-phosphate aldolase
MNILNLESTQGFIRMAGDGYALGWHERNGGNLSYRIKPEEVAEAKACFDQSRPFTPIGIRVVNLAGEYFLVTGSGKFMRNIPLAPEENICIIEVDSTGESYRMVWGLTKGGNPTSELPTHLLNHSVKKEITGGEHRVIYHAHTTNLIALTFLLPLEDRVFSRVLWKSMTECPVVFPDGVGVVSWMVPGGREIGVATSELMKQYDIAIWAHHGTFCSGTDFDTTFGLMHAVEKSAEIYLKVVSAGEIRQTITDQNLKDLAKAFHVNLRKEFLA